MTKLPAPAEAPTMRPLPFLVSLLLACAPAYASEQPHILAALQQFTAGLNQGNTKIVTSICAANAIIIDAIPPFAWQGPHACADWWIDRASYQQKHRSPGAILTLGNPTRLDIAGDVAYAVLSQNCAIALRKYGTIWVITGLAITRR